MPAGDAAEQVVSMSMRGVEVAANVAGKTAVNLAAFLIAALKNREKTHGKASIKAFDGKPTKVFVMNKTDFQKFAKEAKAYGVVYAAIVGKNDNDGLVDVVINARDAAKVNRIAERYSISTVETSIDNSWEENPPTVENTEPDKTADKTEPQKPEIQSEKAKLEKQPPKQKQNEELPTTARTARSNPSAPISPNKSSQGAEYSEKRRSVKEQIKEIKAERKEIYEAKKKEQAIAPVHKQPRKRKTVKTK